MTTSWLKITFKYGTRNEKKNLGEGEKVNVKLGIIIQTDKRKQSVELIRKNVLVYAGISASGQRYLVYR